MNYALEMNQLVKTYGIRGNLYPALNEVNLNIAPREFVGVMGPSGSGKTTLLNLAATIDRPTRGSIRINGVETLKIKGSHLAHFRREQLGFIFQDFNLLDTLTIRENIGLPLTIANRQTSWVLERIQNISEIFGISDILEKFPYQVSGGQKQRAAAARAVIAQPALVLADEPTGALDSRSARVLLETFTRMNQEMGVTLLMVTHDAFAASYCHRIVFLKDGRIVHEITRGTQPRKEFFEKIIEVVAAWGGKDEQ